MMCADLETITHKELKELATIANLRLVTSIAFGVEEVMNRLPAPALAVIGCGSGEFLIPMVFRCPTQSLPNSPAVSLTQRLGADVSAVACAHAVAVLCAEQEG
jgi:uncharacterized hydantoinase/oxoprolinase family protein